MNNVSIDEVESVLVQNKIDQTKVAAIIKDLNKVVAELKADKDPTERKKWEFVIILKDEEGVLAGKEIAGWVVQQEEGEDAGTVLTRLMDAAKAQNERAKQKRAFLTNVTELFEGLKSKFCKDKKVRVKTKELTRVIITNGKFV
jgi:phage gp16-like protein